MCRVCLIRKGLALRSRHRVPFHLVYCQHQTRHLLPSLFSKSIRKFPRRKRPSVLSASVTDTWLISGTSLTNIATNPQPVSSSAFIAVVAEILPEGLNHKGFRNLAGMLNHKYFSVYADKKLQEREWHSDDVYIVERRFVEFVELAVKSVYTPGFSKF
ncbi:duf563 domain-containing protein [Venturia nashicola]|uniref:Duf563 domain-containing protein n=1 Tax=Venturia nashicola TaxID=86259 RepID=A0A4Z1NZF7_9PEZI|nr:duf563 domain-containing protein [Venturia nashicola]